MRGLLAHYADAIAIVLLAAISIALRAIWWGDPASGFDEQLYSLIGQAMLEGRWPYVDVWDRKPFGLFAIYALAHATGGPAPYVYQAVAGIAVLITAVLTYLIAKRLTGVFTAFCATTLMLVLLLVYGARSGQSEVFFLPLMLGMVWMLRDPKAKTFEERAYMAMLLGGFALQVKYTVLPQCLLLGVYALIQLWRRGLGLPTILSRGVHFAILGIVPTAAVFLIYLLMGHADAWLFANVESFFLREAGPLGRFSPEVLAYGLGCVALVLGGYYAAVRFIGPDDTETYRLVLMWSLACLVTVLLPATTYFYYYAAMVPAASLAVIPLIDARGPGKWIPGVALVLIVVAFLRPDLRYAEARERAAAIERLTAAISPLVDQENACLWVHDGPTALYARTRACLPSPVVYPDHINSALEASALPVGQLDEVQKILQSAPAVIVTADGPVSPPNADVAVAVANSIEAKYENLHSENIHGRAISAWLRK